MGVFTFEMEVATVIPPARMFQAFVLDSDNLIPKILPQAIKSVETLEGDGGAGTVKQFKTVKNRIDGIDKEKFTYSYAVIEGDALMNTLEKIYNDVKFEESPEGGSICKSSSTYYTIGDIEIKDEEIKSGKEKALGMFKAVEAHLLANPDAYN
ncbi:Bet v I/Major latex protein - like 10 [Theobroma cacao]|nr:Bet v I/Major latex protein - like 10 [Theobroma cacao]